MIVDRHSILSLVAALGAGAALGTPMPAVLRFAGAGVGNAEWTAVEARLEKFVSGKA